MDKIIEVPVRRVAIYVTNAENKPEDWACQLYSVVAEFHFLPARRILDEACSDQKFTLFNCFVMSGITKFFESLKEPALTMQHAGSYDERHRLDLQTKLLHLYQTDAQNGVFNFTKFLTYI